MEIFQVHCRGWFLASIVLLFLVGLSFGPVLGQAAKPASGYAILIVGDEGDEEMLRREKILIQEMARAIRKLDPQEKLPIYSYHFNKDRERAYCEKRLNILKEDLLFVGVVELKETVPRKVAYRIDRINNPARAAGDVMARAEELSTPAVAAQTPSPSPSPDASPTPDESPTPGADATPGEGGWRIQVGSFTQLKYAEDEVRKAEDKGYEARISRTVSAGVSLFKVFVGDFETRADAEGAVLELKADGFTSPFVVEPAESPAAPAPGEPDGGGDSGQG